MCERVFFIVDNNGLAAIQPYAIIYPQINAASYIKFLSVEAELLSKIEILLNRLEEHKSVKNIRCELWICLKIIYKPKIL